MTSAYAALLLLATAALLSLPSPPVHAAEPVVSFETEDQRARYDRMLEEYRCLKCQNQNLSDSNAALAGDLRREIRTQIIDGADDEAIDGYLVARYGDFVRYRPRFGGLNIVLWVGPFVLLAIGLGAGWTLSRRGRRMPAPSGGTAAGGPAAGGEAVAGTAGAADDDDLREARRLLETR